MLPRGSAPLSFPRSSRHKCGSMVGLSKGIPVCERTRVCRRGFFVCKKLDIVIYKAFRLKKLVLLYFLET